MNTLHFVYIFINWWTFGLRLLSANNIQIRSFMWTYDFNYLRVIFGNSMYNYLRHCHPWQLHHAAFQHSTTACFCSLANLFSFSEDDSHLLVVLMSLQAHNVVHLSIGLLDVRVFSLDKYLPRFHTELLILLLIRILHISSITEP